MSDYRNNPAQRPLATQLRSGDVITPRQADEIAAAELAARGLRLEYDGDGMGGTACAVVEA